MLIQAIPLTEISEKIFVAAGCAHDEAACIARNLVDANLCGHDSHGVIRIMQYVSYLQEGTVRAGQDMTIVHETNTALVVDGNLGMGQVICQRTMERLASKVQQHGMAMGSIRNTGHMGRLGYWAEQLAREGLISLHFLNTTGLGMLAVPFGGTDRRLSLCAVAACVPCEDRPSLLLDFTTTVVAEGKLRVARNRGVPVAPGTIVDKHGRPTTDPNDFYDGGALLPIASHKGHGLNMITDILAGALSGGGCTAPGVEILQNTMTSIAIDPSPIVDRKAYFEEIRRYCDWETGSPPSEPDGEVFVPGDVEQRNRQQREAAGITIDDTTWEQILQLAESYGVHFEEPT